jgi:CheY-like chemotaxis protein/nitrogen-specific signal transduction histidine kinase
MFLLAVVLGSRINREREERERAQKNAFEKEKEVIEARAETKAKGEFFAKMSHEIRTPMNGVLGIVELLKMSELDEKQKDLVNTIQHSGKSLLTIINDLLDLSKFESGKLDLESIPVNTAELINETINVMGSRLRDGPVTLKTHDAIATIPDVLGDPTRICQILMNLTSNALKFTQQGSVTLNQQIEEQHEDQLSIRFEVTDTGIGISEEQQQKLFTPFVQADSSTTRQFGGTGLGLSICKELVELMGGEIGIESSPGKGTTFWFVIPFRLAGINKPSATGPASARQPATNGDQDTEKDITFAGLQALVADDNPVNQSVISGMLTKLGVSCHCCNNGAEALQLLREQPYDIVFLDCEMPVMDGYTASERIKEADDLRGIPVIAVTAHSSDHFREKCEGHNMDDLITKPVTITKLRKAIQDNL